uniref:Reverse transcriptase domain-containing protein n=1 Tax=Amphimedon queenslandica TaxID=400682 RepID=A0A1X7U3D0_AMPQE
MIESGIIEPSTAEWSSPIVLVGKKDGTVRLCVDYRRLNELLTMDAYPIPRVDDIIDRVGKAKLLASSCSQERPTKDQFATPFGLYQFTVMPFGLKGAPATFQRLMDCVIRGLESFVSAYLDNIIVFSESFEEHAKHLERVLLRLREAGLTKAPEVYSWD